jgi:hypothetical protein
MAFSTKNILLTSVAMLPLALGGAANANDYKIGANPTVNVGSGNIIYGIVSGADDLNVNLDTVTSNFLANVYVGATTGNIVVDGKGTGQATATGDYGMFLYSTTSGKVTVQNVSGGITGLNDAIVVNPLTGLTTGNVLITNNGDISSKAFNGIRTYTFGNTTITDNGNISGLASGIAANFAWASPGNVTIDGNKDITGKSFYGVVANTNGGKIDIGTTATNGVITGGTDGIWAVNTTGATTIKVDKNVTGGVVGILTGNLTGTTKITATATTKGGTGILAASTTGDITADGGGSGVATGTVLDGVYLGTLGNANVNKFATATGVRNGIWVAGTGSGKITNVQGNGLVGGVTGTTDSGIVVGATLGDVNIGTTTTNGVIMGGQEGIWVNGTVGKTTIVTDKDVTGKTDKGIVSSTTTGASSITSKGGHISGATWGILNLSTIGNLVVDLKNTLVTGNAAVESSTSGAGTVTTNIDAASVVNGTTWGYVTTTGTGTGITNNSGTIRTKADNGLSGDTGLVATIWVKGGTKNTINNNSGGKIYGGFSDAGVNTVFNNNAGAEWDVALANLMNATSTINNAGVMNIRKGSTVGVGVTNNLSGGLVDLTYGGTSPDATDYLYTYGYNAIGGSITKFNVDFTKANDSGLEGLDDDHTTGTGGLGTADTIGSIADSTPGAGALISLVNIGGPAVGTSGSIALIINSGNAGFGVADPGLGGLPTLLASSHYLFADGSDPSTGAVKAVLMEDGFGGVSLVWAPNITAASMGGFFGGTMGGSGASAASTIGGASGSSAGVGGGLSGGPSGGGVSGSIAEAAASSAQHRSNCFVGKDSLDNTYSNENHVWVSMGGSRSSFDGGGSANDAAGTIGIEHDLGANMGLGCGDLAIGTFGTVGTFGSDATSGSQSGKDGGVGVYVKAASQQGLYASLLGSVIWSNTNMNNAVFGSTASQNSRTYLGTASVGFTQPVSETIGFDSRLFGTVSHTDGSGFTDSKGIIVDGSNTDLLTVGFMLGLDAKLGEATKGFIRGGAKWVQSNQSATAFGITVGGSASAFVKSAEAGFETDVSNGATFTGKVFGDITDGATSYGGDLALRFKL